MRIVTGLIEFEFERHKGRFDLGDATSAGVALKDAGSGLAWRSLTGRKNWTPAMTERCTIEQEPLEDVHGRCTEVRFSEPIQALRLTQTWRFYEALPHVTVRMAVQNLGGETALLDSFTLFDAGHMQGRLTLDGPARVFFKAGWHDWVYSGLRRADDRDVTTRLGYFTDKALFNPALPIGRGKGDFWSDGFGVLAAERSALVSGFISTLQHFGVLHARCRAGNDALALIAQADGIPLAPGETFTTDWGMLRFYRLPCDDLLGEFFLAAARQMWARVPQAPPPLKWTHWYHYFQNISEELFLENLDEIRRTRQQIPISTVQLDDGYQSAWGDWDACNEKFPHGLGSLADHIRAGAFTPGLWLAPFVADPKSRIAKEHPNWLVRNENGRPIRSGFFYQFFGHALDASHPGVLDHLQRLMEKIRRDWGFRFVKTDFLYAGALPGVRYNPHLTRAQVLRQGLECIRAGLGEDVFLLGCGCPFGPAVGVVDAMRIGPDTAPNWRPYLWNVPWAADFIKEERSIASLRNNLRHTLNLSAAHRRLWWNDPDCLMVRKTETRLTAQEVQSSLTLTGLSGGQLIISDDLRRLDGERRRWLSLLHPIYSPGGTALDLLEREMPELYVCRMQAAWGAWTLAAIFNWDDEPRTKSLDFARLGLPADEELHVFDFWRAETARARGGMDLGAVAPHGCRLLRLSPADGHPCLTGSTLHITQGGEVLDWTCDGQGLHVQLRDTDRPFDGDLIFSLNQEPQEATINGKPTALKNCGRYLYNLHWNGAGA